MILRYPFALGAAFAVTSGIFFGMQLLIADSDGELKERVKSPPIEMVRVKRDTPPMEKKRELPQKPKTTDEPPPPSMEMSDPGAPGASVAVPIAAPTPQANLNLKAGPNLGAAAVADSAATPLVRVNPTVPRKAKMEGVGGSVLVRFDIGPTGRTQNIVIIEEQPVGYGFGNAVMRAVSRWKYRPKVIDGQGVIQKGLQVRFPFKIESR